MGALFFVREFDLPTLSFCRTFDQQKGFLEYGNDFLLEFTVIEDQEKVVILEENKSVQTLFSLKIHLSELLPRLENHLQVEWDQKLVNRQCYKVTCTVLRGSMILGTRTFQHQTQNCGLLVKKTHTD